MVAISVVWTKIIRSVEDYSRNILYNFCPYICNEIAIFVFPIINQWQFLSCHSNQSSYLIWTKKIQYSFPKPILMASEMLFENVDGRQMKDAWLNYKLTYGELLNNLGLPQKAWRGMSVLILKDWVKLFMHTNYIGHITNNIFSVIKYVKKQVKFLSQCTLIWTASSEFGTYRICEQGRFRRACASAQSRQNLRCSLIQAVGQEEPSDRKPDP